MKIDKGIPAPTTRAKACKYPFGEMEVGDSFAVPAEDANTVRGAKCMHEARHPGIKYVSRTMMEDQGKVVRFWRIA